MTSGAIPDLLFPSISPRPRNPAPAVPLTPSIWTILLPPHRMKQGLTSTSQAPWRNQVASHRPPFLPTIRSSASRRGTRVPRAPQGPPRPLCLPPLTRHRAARQPILDLALHPRKRPVRPKSHPRGPGIGRKLCPRRPHQWVPSSPWPRWPPIPTVSQESSVRS